MQTYSLEAFYVARSLMLMPLGWVWPTLWLTGVYWLSNANPSFASFVTAQLALYFSYSVYEGVGQAISASGMSMPHAITFGMILITYWFGWCGLFMDVYLMPSWMQWIPDGNLLLYSFQLITHVVLTDDLQFSCKNVHITARDLSWDACSSSTDQISGSEAKVLLGITHSSTTCLAVLIVSFVFFRALAYLLLRRDLRQVIHGVPGSKSESPKESVSDRVSDKDMKVVVHDGNCESNGAEEIASI